METSTPFSLQTLIAILGDMSQIQNCQLEWEIDFLRHKKWPQFIKELCILGKAFESTLITGEKLVVSAEFPLQEGSLLPRFCYTFFSQVLTEDGVPHYTWDEHRKVFLDSDKMHDGSGILISQKNAHCVFLLRQLLLAFSKAKDVEPDTDSQSELESFQRRITSQSSIRTNSAILAIARKLLHEVFYDSDDRLHPFLEQWRTIPWGRHGPGAVAMREKGLEKWNFVADCLRLPKDLYTDTYGQPIGGSSAQFVSCSRVSLVPKDFRGHRIICIEPKEAQYAQQALFQVLSDIIHSHPLTKGAINFKRQDLSYEFSRNLSSISTIDLKDASDYLSLRLCRLLLPKEVFALFTRYRSTSVMMPDGRVISNYSSAFTMGNALCFPVMTLILWALSAATVMTDCGSKLPVSGSFRLPLRVFGDDIIIGSKYCDYLIRVLEDSGLVVNRNKTCHRSLVREACGSWWFAGKDTRITKLKYSSNCTLESWVSIEDVIDQQIENGMLTLASVLRASCDLIYPTLRSVLSAEQDVKKKYLRFNLRFQRLEYKRPVEVTTTKVALPGRLGFLAWWTDQNKCSLYSTTQCRIKYSWTPVN